MAQHIVVRCFSCRTHQVVQENKKQKFACKLCGASQSVLGVLARGAAGKELRQIVQQLNYTKGKEAEEQRARLQSAAFKASEPLPLPAPEPEREPLRAEPKWARFVEPVSPAAPIEAPPEVGVATNFGAGWALGARPKKRGAGPCDGRKARRAKAEEPEEEEAVITLRDPFAGGPAEAFSPRAFAPEPRAPIPVPKVVPTSAAPEPSEPSRRWARFLGS
ncbi:unnamed protein product [Effrenium voratum]|nr:unnamed protein product [Effrenium voratum]